VNKSVDVTERFLKEELFNIVSFFYVCLELDEDGINLLNAYSKKEVGT
jgi:hypothetical protein